MIIEIVDVAEPQSVKKYFTIEVSYKQDGKIAGKKLMSFLHPEVYATLKDAKRGEVYDVVSEKNDKGYWEWISVTKGGSVNVPENVSGSVVSTQRDFKKESTTVKSNYETKEERAARQVMIVRQSSLSTAVASLAVAGKNAVDPDKVIEVAKKFEDYVLGGTARDRAEQAVADIEDDIPY